MDLNDSERNPLDVLAEEFAQRCRRGEEPSVQEYAVRYPQYADELRALLPPVATMEALKRRRAEQTTKVRPARPERVGDYAILREIGRGGMGIVYEAEQKALGRRVALKVLPRHFLLDAKRLQRFQREAQAAAQLHHTNIVPVFGVGECDGLHYYVMQFVDGRGLNEVVAALKQPAALKDTPPAAGAWPQFPKDGSAGQSAYWRWVATLGVQVAEALQYAHAQGILHRDVKPANIVLDSRGSAWVTDFGLAKLMEQSDLTAAGEIIGTLQYLAPEMLQSQADTRSDVCSLGLTLYELLTLQPPYRETSPSALMRAISEQDPEPPRRLNPLVPRDLETIVLKATARNPQQRYQSAAELGDDLRRFLDDRPIRARQAHVLERCWRWCRRNRAISALSGAALLFLFLALGVGWIGYVRTTEALERESRRRADADAATRRAEKNVALSLQALEQMFEQIETPPELMPFAHLPPPQPQGARHAQPPAPPETRENAALLQSILEFYDRFAQENSADDKLQAEAAKAHRRIGDIRQRLGELDQAYAAYQQALAMATQLQRRLPAHEEYVALLAEIHGRIGSLLRRMPQPRQAEEHLRQALALARALAQQSPQHSEHQLSLALAVFAMGEFLQRANRSQEARPLLEESIAGMQAYRSTTKKPALERALGLQYRCLAEACAALGERKLADEARRRADELNPPPPPPRGPPPDFGPPPRPRPAPNH